MVESMVERVARAIAGADPEQQGQIDDSEMGEYFWGNYREHYLPLARAAIEAMREPTDAMIMAAEWAEQEYREDDRDMAIQLKSEWRAAIDAALKEQVSG